MIDYTLYDLTHSITEDIPVWPGSTPFSKHLQMDYDQLARVYDYQHSESVGTHIDAPAHFFEHGKSIDQIPLTQLITHACVIDIREKAQADCDYALSVEDIGAYEGTHGEIPPNAIVLAYTGWSERWQNPSDYLNADTNGTLHFPGFGKEAAEILEQKNIAGIGIDTISLDPGESQDFPVHHIMLGNGKIQIENLTNLHLLPAKGAFIAALPLKIAEGPEAPARVVAFVPPRY